MGRAGPHRNSNVVRVVLKARAERQGPRLGGPGMQGLHLTADLYQCACSQALLIQADTLADFCRRLTIGVGLTLVDEKWFTFPDHDGQPGGVTGMLLLAESHLAIHTWPERGGVTLDVYVCNFTGDNSAKAEQLCRELMSAFKPVSKQLNRLHRGLEDGEAEDGVGQQLLLEEINPHSVYGFRSRRLLEACHTPYQALEVHDTPQFGRLLRLDGHFMTSEKEEFFYHEALVHPAALAHPNPRRALIIGGGDGGAAEELLKHPSLEKVVVAELDAQVVEAARRHLGHIHGQVFDDPRLELKIGDGFAYLAETNERYDLILLDLTDPETPAGTLYTPEAFAACRRALNPGGALALHIGTPVFEPDQVRNLASLLADTFPSVACYGLYIPLYGAYWGLAVASDSLAPRQVSAEVISKRLAERNIGDLSYYNPEVHCALFALPNFYRNLLG